MGLRDQTTGPQRGGTVLAFVAGKPHRRPRVEISSHYPYYLATGAVNPEDQVSAQPEAAKRLPEPQALETSEGDRVELVRGQNLASPPVAEVDLKETAVLLRQVAHQLSLMSRQEMRELYQFDRLRELCCRLQEPEGA